MISNSKILTVSYGTFSCTLEGFDDSFGTMKAIAEYFRDLAADDRYFGAEPPTPDAEMLARIAEREIARRVQAHEDGGKIVLRAEQAFQTGLISGGQAVPTASPTTPKTDAFTAPQPAPLSQPVPAAEQDDTPDTAEVAALTPEPTAEAMPEPAIEPLEDQMADTHAPDDVAERDPDTMAENEGQALTADNEEPHAAETTQEPETDEETMDWSDEGDEIGFSDLPDDDDAEFPAAESAGQESDDSSEVAHPDPESVAAKLRRIRSVVAQSGSDYGLDYSEDEHAQDFLSTNVADLDAVLAEDDANEPVAEDHDDASEAEADMPGEMLGDDQSEETEDDMSSILANISANASAAEAQTEAEAEVEDEPETPAAAKVFDDDYGSKKSAFEDTLAQLLADAMPLNEVKRAQAKETQNDPIDTAEGEPDSRPLDARVVKMKRTDLEQAMSAGLIEEVEEAPEENLFSEEDTIGGDDEAPDSTLSPEEEAELQRELAELEAEFSSEDTSDEATALDDDDTDFGYDDAETMDDEDEDDVFDSVTDSNRSEKGVDKLQRMKREGDLSRIFDEADNQLDEPDSSKRRNAIQHLRAAVAATRADKKAGVDMAKDVDDRPYRSDLADVVRPRRPDRVVTRSERPAGERPAPLKLVAEQRIDISRDPVRPRRVSTRDVTVEPALSAEGSSFVEFAEEVGATSLPELLEAAAAYLADVEGRPQFSRPMLMGKLKEVEGETFSREDGLRSFGQLLRQGKLQKLNGGRFAVTEETEFRAPRRSFG